MEDIKIFSEKTLEMDFNMYSSIDDESMEMFYASGCVHPRFKLINKIESKLPITVKVRNRSVSSSLLLSGDLDIMVRDDDFINCLDEFISSKGLPLYVMREGRFPEIKNVIVKDNTIKKMTLKIPVMKKDKDFILPTKFDIYQEVFDMFDCSEMTVSDSALYYDKGLHLKGKFNFPMENPNEVFKLIPLISENKHIKSFYIEQLYVGEAVASIKINACLNKFEEDFCNEW